MKIKKLKNYAILSEDGTLLFVSMIVLTSIFTAVLGSASLMLSGIIISGTQSRSTQAYFAAEAGIEESLWWARKSSTSTTSLENDIESVASGTLSNNATYNVDYNTWGYIRNFRSDGIYNRTRRTVESQYGYTPWDRIVYKCDSTHLDLCDSEVACEDAGGTWIDDACS